MKDCQELAAELRASCSDPHPKGGVMLYNDAVADFLQLLIQRARREFAQEAQEKCRRLKQGVASTDYRQACTDCANALQRNT